MNDPVAMRRRLRVELKRLRTHANFTQRQVAEALEWSPSKIIRIEQGSVAVGVTDLRALLGHYGLTDQRKIEELVSLARGSRKQPFVEYRDVFSQEMIKFFGYEATASVLRQWESVVIPGLLQTEDYTRALLEAHDITADKADRYVASRRERQELFDRPNPPESYFILDESVLFRPIGGKSVMRGQLQHLLDVASHPHVTIQVLPLALGAHGGLRGPFVLLEFPSANDPDVLFLENRLGIERTFRDEPEITALHREIFWRLEDQASRPDELDSQVHRAVEALAEIAERPKERAAST